MHLSIYLKMSDEHYFNLNFINLNSKHYYRLSDIYPQVFHIKKKKKLSHLTLETKKKSFKKKKSKKKNRASMK